MENVLTRYRNTTILVAVLFAQIIGLAVQVKKPTEAGPMRLLRYWVVSAITPLERGAVNTSHGIRHIWTDYLYLRGVRAENRALKEQIDQMRINDVRLQQDADQARRLQALLAFKEKFISDTVAAQVIGTSGSEQSRIIYIDKGFDDGLKTDMAVITPGGVVGKVLHTTRHAATVLEIGDQSSGVGAILEKSRLQGILRGSGAGEVSMQYVMSDEKVEPGERVLTSGGDKIFPKGLPIGNVTDVHPGRDLFLNIRVKPSADLSRLEEVLVITKMVEKEPDAAEASGPVRASDILAQRLPTVEKKAPAAAAKPGAAPAAPPGAAAAPAKPSTETASKPKPEAQKPITSVPGTPAPAATAKPEGVKPATPAQAGSQPPATGAAARPKAQAPAASSQPAAQPQPQSNEAAPQ
jgi:rod shape-determining protein MreC